MEQYDHDDTTEYLDQLISLSGMDAVDATMEYEFPALAVTIASLSRC